MKTGYCSKASSSEGAWCAQAFWVEIGWDSSSYALKTPSTWRLRNSVAQSGHRRVSTQTASFLNGNCFILRPGTSSNWSFWRFSLAFYFASDYKLKRGEFRVWCWMKWWNVALSVGARNFVLQRTYETFLPSATNLQLFFSSAFSSKISAWWLRSRATTRMCRAHAKAWKFASKSSRIRVRHRKCSVDTSTRPTC